MLIPEITVKRGVMYTFEVFGGDDSEYSAEYHPFYITDDAEGGYVQKSDPEKAVCKMMTSLLAFFRWVVRPFRVFASSTEIFSFVDKKPCLMWSVYI